MIEGLDHEDGHHVPGAPQATGEQELWEGAAVGLAVFWTLRLSVDSGLRAQSDFCVRLNVRVRGLSRPNERKRYLTMLF